MDLIKPTRRGFLGLLGGLLAAPAIVRAGSLMPVKVLPPPDAFEQVVMAFGPNRPFGETVVIGLVDELGNQQIRRVTVDFEGPSNGDTVHLFDVPAGSRVISTRLEIGGLLGDCGAKVVAPGVSSIRFEKA
jgi:hypothetical protein